MLTVFYSAIHAREPDTRAAGMPAEWSAAKPDVRRFADVRIHILKGTMGLGSRERARAES